MITRFIEGEIVFFDFIISESNYFSTIIKRRFNNLKNKVLALKKNLQKLEDIKIKNENEIFYLRIQRDRFQHDSDFFIKRNELKIKQLSDFTNVKYLSQIFGILEDKNNYEMKEDK